MVFVILSAAAFVACTTSECYENKSSLPLAGFYSSAASPKAISVDSITIFGIGAPGDSILLDSGRNVSSVYLPFRMNADKSEYVIKYLQKGINNDRLNDTITFEYDVVPWFVSDACGAIYRFEMKTINTTHHLIDSVTCPTMLIDNTNAENLRIYFRVSTEE
jgi:hypothetical protein